jgi:Mn2+/Fe2+ NRAMP family transporter
MGQVTLPEVLELPWGVVVFAVVVIAVLGFWGATKVERWIGSRS